MLQPTFVLRVMRPIRQRIANTKNVIATLKITSMFWLRRCTEKTDQANRIPTVHIYVVIPELRDKSLPISISRQLLYANNYLDIEIGWTQDAGIGRTITEWLSNVKVLANQIKCYNYTRTMNRYIKSIVPYHQVRQ